MRFFGKKSTDAVLTAASPMIPNEETLLKEFEELASLQLSTQRGKSISIAEKYPNKNRYLNIIPYDDTRVVLKPTGTIKNTYINASHISLKCTGQKYIAASAPPKSAIIDFWTMIYQKKVGCIIMLTNEVESGKRKCDRYWPPRSKVIVFGEIGVKMVEEHECNSFTWRVLQIINKNEKKGFVVRHYHFNKWPDFHVPETPLGIIAMNQHVRKYCNKNATGTTLMHCSAGVGRTGTYLAIDIVRRKKVDTSSSSISINGISSTKHVIIPKLVTEMRTQRMGMVQTFEQYKFCYICMGASYSEKELEQEFVESDTYIFNENDHMTQEIAPETDENVVQLMEGLTQQQQHQ